MTVAPSLVNTSCRNVNTMGEPPLSTFEVIRFLVNKGGRCTNYELVSNFRGILNDPQYQAEARLKFKDIINTVAIVGEFQNVKYIELKKEHFPNNNVQHDQDVSTRSPGNSSGHSSLSSETSTSSYTSPLTQNFQPYWRYRLSTSSQVLPSRRIEQDSFLQSPASKSSIPFNRSVSESTLPQDGSLPPRTRTSRSSSVEQEYYDSAQNLHSLEWPRQSINDSKGPPRYYVPDRPTSGYPPRYYESRVHSYSDRPANGNIHSSQSLPYYGSESSPEYEMKQRLQDEVFRTSIKENSYVPESRSEISSEINSHKTGLDRTRIYENHVDKVSNHMHPQHHMNFPVTSQDQRRKSFDDRRSVNVEHPIRSFKSNLDNSPSFRNSESKESSPAARYCNNNFNESRSVKKESEFQIRPEINGESDSENNVFIDPEYMRTVSKLCLEKVKSHRSPMSTEKSILSSERQREINKDSKLESIPTNGPISAENLTDRNSEVGKTCNMSTTDNPMVVPEETAPVPPERRRRNHERIPKQAEEVKDTKSDMGEQEVLQNPVPNKVRDRVQHFDEMEKKQRKESIDKENVVVVTNKAVAMEDDVSISVLDPKLKREWFVKASQCEYHSLVALLKKEPKLAALKDVASGYTALHWAAKQGDANVIKLIAGAYKVNPNIRSNGGYTPVHLASLYKHDMISHLLIHTYGADPSIRDYSGKRADQYPDNYIRLVAGHKNTERRPLKQRPLVAKEASTNSFIRIGSLNLRKARKSAMFASVRSSHRNRASVPELRLGSHGSTRKKAHKSLYLEKSIIEKKNDSDSDSAYGFPSKK